MAAVKRKLLSGDDLKELYRITNPKMDEKPHLYMVIRANGEDWQVESSHPLRGYRACQSNLESRVRQYESKDIWPDQCDLGIGVFEGEGIVRVLIAGHRGYKPMPESQPSLPLDDILAAMGISRSDIGE